MYREMKGMWTSNKHLTLIFSDSLVNINTHALTWIGGIHTHTLSGLNSLLKCPDLNRFLVVVVIFCISITLKPYL